jgi:hypothetical protein
MEFVDVSHDRPARGGQRLTMCRLLALAGLAMLAGAWTPAEAAAGCAPHRPAVAHRAGGAVLARQPDNPPIPCIDVVGRTSESASVGIGRTGSLFFAPLNTNTSAPPQNTLEGPENVVRSRDGGGTWATLSSGGPTTGGFVPPWMHVDPQTSRIWFSTTLPTLCGARISWSDDDGDTWRTNPAVGCPAQGANKVLEGPPPRGAAKPTGYPHVVYFCANGQDTMASTVYCYRSLDGGQSFTAVASPDPPRPDGCDEQHPARAGIVASDGVLYFPTSVCGELGVAISRDEGATWVQRHIAKTAVEDTYIATDAADAAGNLYLAYIGARGLPALTISRDHGATWSAPTTVRAPAVKEVRRVAVAAGRRGQIALAYQGSTDRNTFHGYVTTTADALARKPLYWSAPLNDPAHPLVYAANPQGFGDRLLYQTDAFAPDGTVLAGFHCARTSTCPDRRVGMFGRLLAPSNRFTVRRFRQVPKRGQVLITAILPGPGRYTLAGKALRTVVRHPRHKGAFRVAMSAGGAGLRALRKTGRFATVVRISYAPTGGASRTRSRPIVLRLIRTGEPRGDGS